MLSIDIICVGKLKEKYLQEACNEYIKRLSAYCKLSVTEIAETPLPKSASAAVIAAALRNECGRMEIAERAALFALCVEGERMSSQKFAGTISAFAAGGLSRLVFVIGGSNGLSDELKKRADFRLSMSDMTFPHHLARVMLLEQVYRAFNMIGGGRYHK